MGWWYGMAWHMCVRSGIDVGSGVYVIGSRGRERTRVHGSGTEVGG